MSFERGSTVVLVCSANYLRLSLCCSIARCLGAKRVSKRSFEWLSQHPVITQVVADKEAVEACINIAGKIHDCH